MSDKSRTTFKMNYKPFVDSRNGYLVDYLKSQSENTEFRKVVFNILEIWAMPAALKGLEGVDLEHETWVSIQALLDRISFLAALNNLDDGQLVNFISRHFNGRFTSADSVINELQGIREAIENLKIVASGGSDVDKGEQSKSAFSPDDVSALSDQEMDGF